MKVSLLVFLCAFLMAGCANFGPDPANPNYAKAIKGLNIQSQVVYAIAGSWFPNTILGSIDSFSNPSSAGTLFVTNDRLVFALYDESTTTFLEAFSVPYSDITWISGDTHGLSYMLRLRTSANVSSFLYTGGVDGNGTLHSKEVVSAYILGKF